MKQAFWNHLQKAGKSDYLTVEFTLALEFTFSSHQKNTGFSRPARNFLLFNCQPTELELPYEGAKPMLPVTILDDKTVLQNMVKEMYPELPERKVKKKKV